MDYQAIGRTVRAERERQGVSQTELAEWTGLHYNTIQKVELGKGKLLSFDAVAKICRVLRISLDELDEKHGGPY